ncbi:Mucin-associated surface protein (MASP) [Trypanosoma cruzi]|uniref:Mucin-associated surface protein (MASP) n=1 Tax=Trypanosoma cruzi TaxID=5693 RepID=A0A2V2UYG1_TRYCR|nr:Mucin-associated surface protein (MASP) [Trypanosoma cruzi]
MAMMMTGRVLLVCALCVLLCVLCGVCAEGQEAGTLSPPPGLVHGDQGSEASGIGSKKADVTDGQVTVDGVRDPAESKHLSRQVSSVGVNNAISGAIGGAGNGTVEEVGPEDASLQNSCDEDGERSEGCVQLPGGDNFPGSGGGQVDRGRQQDDRKLPLHLTDQTSSEEINLPLPDGGNPQHQPPVSRQVPEVVEKQTDPVIIRPQEEAATLESEAVRNAADSHSQESAVELANGTLPAHARVTEAEDRSKHIVDTHKEVAEKQKKPVHTTGKGKSTAASGDAHKITASTAAVDNEAAIKKEKSPGGASSPTSISDNSNNDTEQNNAKDTSEEASHSTENATTHSAGIPRETITIAKTDDTATQEDSNIDGGTVKVGEAAPQTAWTAQKNDTTTPTDSDGSITVSHTKFPLLLLLFVATAATAVVAA